MMQDMRGYRIQIEPLADDLGGGFLATVPELDGCMSDGATPEEALRNAYDAIGCWLDTAAERTVPPAAVRVA